MKLKKLLYILATVTGIVGGVFGWQKYTEPAKSVIEVVAEEVDDSVKVFKSNSELPE